MHKALYVRCEWYIVHSRELEREEEVLGGKCDRVGLVQDVYPCIIGLKKKKVLRRA
jgi:hypothetical protein